MKAETAARWAIPPLCDFGDAAYNAERCSIPLPDASASVTIFYTDVFVLPLPEEHRFPMERYALLRERIIADGTASLDQLHIPEAATWEQISLAHDDSYLDRVRSGTLTKREVLRIGFPWSEGLVERSRRSSGATIEAGRSALQHGVGINLAGGTHHAFADAGEGYCLFNDSIIAARVLQAEGIIERVLVVDLDVHQGNGTAAIAAGDDTIFTFSVHGAKNFPSRKMPSDLDVPLPDGTDDGSYLDHLTRSLNAILNRFSPDLVIFLAGADPYRDDRLGRLALTKFGLAERDRLVLRTCHERGFPVVITMAGGYAHNVNDIVDIQSTTVRLALDICRR